MNQTQRDLFIKCLREEGLEATCARRANSSLKSVQKEYEQDEAFYEEALEAKAMVADRVEAEAYRRAVEGVEKPVYYQGALVDTVTEYSDTLLAKMLTGLRPEVYGDKRQITGAKEGPIKIIIEEFDFL